MSDEHKKVTDSYRHKSHEDDPPTMEAMLRKTIVMQNQRWSEVANVLGCHVEEVLQSLARLEQERDAMMDRAWKAEARVEELEAAWKVSQAEPVGSKQDS